jgi:hypothetical protein
MSKASAANSFLYLWAIASMSKPLVSQNLVYNEDLNDLVVAHSDKKPGPSSGKHGVCKQQQVLQAGPWHED